MEKILFIANNLYLLTSSDTSFIQNMFLYLIFLSLQESLLYRNHSYLPGKSIIKPLPRVQKGGVGSNRRGKGEDRQNTGLRLFLLRFKSMIPLTSLC